MNTIFIGRIKDDTMSLNKSREKKKMERDSGRLNSLHHGEIWVSPREADISRIIWQPCC